MISTRATGKQGLGRIAPSANVSGRDDATKTGQEENILPMGRALSV